jgi:hypothetical protein
MTAFRTPLRKHHSPGSLAAKEESLQIDVHHFIPVGLNGGVIAAKPSIVHQDVQPPEEFLNGRKAGLHLREVTHIKGKSFRLTTFGANFFD